MTSTNPHDRLLDTATKLFQHNGIQAVGINRILAEADVALMTLYRHFGGKDQLVAATLEQWSIQWLTGSTMSSTSAATIPMRALQDCGMRSSSGLRARTSAARSSPAPPSTPQ